MLQLRPKLIGICYIIIQFYINNHHAFFGFRVGFRLLYFFKSKYVIFNLLSKLLFHF